MVATTTADSALMAMALMRPLRSASTAISRSLVRVRAATELPCTVGFGIRSSELAAAIARISDGVVVGSAIVGRVAENLGHGKERVVAEVLELTRALAGSTHAARHGKVPA